VLTNLVDNAIKFSPPGETVRVDTWRRGDEVGVTVTDAGPGVSPADEEHLFDRFFRVGNPLSPDFGGSGLGLAISREVALAHDGRIWVDSPPGGGSAFTLALPSWRSLPSEASGTVAQDDPA
jgi:signal transduction histidine kinase